jgi:signal peptidase
VRKTVPIRDSDLLELSKDIFKTGKSIRFRAKGWSMRPFIRDGDFIVVSPVEYSLIKTGDVVFYLTAKNKALVHRVIKKSKKDKDDRITMFIKGDATFSTPEKTDTQNVLGKVVAVERNGRKKRLDTKLYQLAGLLLAVISPYSQWTYPLLSKIKKYFNN